MSNSVSRSAIAVAAACALVGSASAQSPQLQVYVDPNATSTFDGIVPSLAYPTIGEAVTHATQQFPLMQSGAVVTIHVAPGTYPEQLNLPAHGIRFEPYGSGVMPTLTQPIKVDTSGDASLGATTFDHLHFHATPDFPDLYQLVIDDSIGSAAVHVTGCRFTVDTAIAACVSIRSQNGSRIEHVVEASTFVSSRDHDYIVAIWETCFGGSEVPYSSCLYRGNDITNFETSLYIVGCSGFEERMRPRILSNAMRRGERIVQVAYASPRCVNNTVALFKDFGNAMFDDVWGIAFEGCFDFVVANNIVWFEPTVGNDLGDLAKDLAATITAPSVVTSNYLSDTAGNSNPLVGGVGPQLNVASGLNNQGDVSWCVPPQSLPFAGSTVSADISVDYQGDMRCRIDGVTPYVAIGCDQLEAPRAAVVPAAGVDSFDNLLLDLPTTAGYPSSPFTIRTSNLPTGGAMLMALSLLPPGMVLAGTTTPLDPIQQHAFATPFGSVTTLPIAPLLLSTGSVAMISAGGVEDLVFTLPAGAITQSLLALQTQQRLGLKLYAQGFILGPGGTFGVATNRVEIGVELDPAQW